MKYSINKRNTFTLLSVWTPDLTGPPPVILVSVHAAPLPHPIIPDSTPETITHLSSITGMIQSPTMNVVFHPLCIRMSVTTMTDVTGVTLHHAHPISTPGMVVMMMTLTDTDAVLVQLHRETEMQVHTLGAVFDSSHLKDLHTPAPTDRETSINCC